MDKRRTFAFVKRFEDKKHAENLLNQGELYCQTLSYFKKLEDDEVGNRADQNEGLFGIHYPQDLSEFNIGGISIPISDLADAIKIHDTTYDSCNIYCLTYIGIDGTETSVAEVSERSKLPKTENKRNLGDHVVCIIDPNEFLLRIKKKLEELKIDGKNKHVKYIDLSQSTYTEPENIGFTKDKTTYGHQREYRILLFTFSNEPLFIHIGPLHDIAKLTSVDEFNNNLHFEQSIDLLRKSLLQVYPVYECSN